MCPDQAPKQNKKWVTPETFLVKSVSFKVTAKTSRLCKTDLELFGIFFIECRLLTYGNAYNVSSEIFVQIFDHNKKYFRIYNVFFLIFKIQRIGHVLEFF